MVINIWFHKRRGVSWLHVWMFIPTTEILCSVVSVCYDYRHSDARTSRPRKFWRRPTVHYHRQLSRWLRVGCRRLTNARRVIPSVQNQPVAAQWLLLHGEGALGFSFVRHFASLHHHHHHHHYLLLLLLLLPFYTSPGQKCLMGGVFRIFRMCVGVYTTMKIKVITCRRPPLCTHTIVKGKGKVVPVLK